MNQVARVFVVINLLLAAGFLMAAATFLKQNEDWKGKEAMAREEMATLEQEKDRIIGEQDADNKRLRDDLNKRDNKIAALENERDNLESRRQAAVDAQTTAQSQVQQLTHTNNQLSNKVGELASHMEGMDGLIDRYRDRSESADKARAAAEVEKTTTSEDLDQRIRTIHARDSEIAQLNNHIKAIQTELDRYRAAYPPPDRKDQPKVDGQVSRYDRSTALVQINRGSSNGVQIGHHFDIVRGQEFICTVVVDRVDANSSIGSIVLNRRGREPQSGDRATSL